MIIYIQSTILNEVTMKNKALLITGLEFRFRREVVTFKRILEQSGCEVQITSSHSYHVLGTLVEAVSRLETNQKLLVAFHGHGSKFGWEGDVPYTLLARALSATKEKLLIINDTCFGLTFLEHLQGKRSPDNTCFISSWDSLGVSYGGPIRDAIKFWPKGKITEDCITSVIHSTDGGDKEFPPQQHWGSRFEHYFFPNQ